MTDNRDDTDDPARRYRHRQRWLRLGQITMLAGVIVLVVHWLTHLEAFGPGQPEGWVDLVAGYPMGALLLLVGAIAAGHKPS
ncbi:hypothetical protein [Microbacterium sp. NPDC080220]|uniref:hypothetical protein n=1 Tax=Microbacterium TaxID=33882 RepID=UPI00343FAC26